MREFDIEADFVSTRQYRMALKLAQTTIDAGPRARIGQITGSPGTGKTIIGKRLALDLGGVRVCCRQHVSSKAMFSRIARTIGGVAAPSGGTSNTFIDWLVDHVDGVAIMVDEADKLKWGQLELLRHLADEGGAAIILIGTELLKTYVGAHKRDVYVSQLESRIGAKKLTVTPLTADEIARHVIAPRLGGAAVDKAVAKRIAGATGGFWGAATEFVEGCQRMMAANDRPALDAEIVEATLREWATLAAPKEG